MENVRLGNSGLEKRWLPVVALTVGWFVRVVGTLRADVTAQQVRQAIESGVSYLQTQQHGDGSWIDFAIVAKTYPGGVSALCTLALLNSGVTADDQRIQSALAHLREIKPEWTYVVSLQTMVFARAEPERDRLLISRNVRWLENAQITEGPYTGARTYLRGGRKPLRERQRDDENP